VKMHLTYLLLSAFLNLTLFIFMKQFNLFLLFLTLNYLAFSQKITVFDKSNEKVIENVIIYDENNSVHTNANGQADFSLFKNSKSIIFKHTSYKDLNISYDDAKKNNFKIYLVKSVLDINEVVISASSWEQNKNEVPNRITVISKEQLALNNFQTSADLLKLSGEVFIQKSQLGGGSPMIRGFSANRVLLVVDGVRMNNAIFRSGNLQNVISIDANSIESSEIIFGPGSVIYGSDALGGVMDFHTLKLNYSENNNLNVSANSVFRFSSANNEKTGHIDFNIFKNNFSSITSFSYSDYDDLKMGSVEHEEYTRPEYVETVEGRDIIVKNLDPNVQKFSGYSQINILQKFGYKPNEFWDINYAFHYSETSDVPRYDRLLQYSDGKLKYAQWYYGPQKWMLNSLSIINSKQTKLFSNAKLTIAYQDYSESRHDRKLNKDAIRERYENVKAYSANIDFEKELKNNSFIFYGAEAVINKVYSNGVETNIFDGTVDGTEEPTASRYPDDSDYSTFASYISYKRNITKNFTINSGLRYNRVYANAVLDTVFYDFPFKDIDLNTGAFNGSLGFVYRPKTWQFSFNASTGFRAPNIDDMAKVFDSEPGSVIVPNDNLKSEIAYNVDFGIVKTINDIFKIDVALFYTYLDDALIRKDFTFNGLDSIMYDGELSKVQAVVNEDNAVVYGFQIALKVDISNNFDISSNYNYTKGYDAEDLPLRHVAPAFGSTHLRYKNKRFVADLFAEYNAEISYEDLAESEIDKTYMYATDENGNPYSPSWYTINLNTSFKVNKSFTVKVGVENILDHRYRPYSSGIVAPGRNFIFSLSSRIN